MFQAEEQAFVHECHGRGDERANGDGKRQENDSGVKQPSGEGNGHEVDEDTVDVNRVKIVGGQRDDEDLGGKAEAYHVVTPF